MPNDSIGALWAKTSERGDYFTGSVTINGTTTKIVVFANGYKQEEKHPDFKIYVSKPREGQ